MSDLEIAWRQPDDGIWEVRGGSRHFVYSKVMAWVAFDRAIRLFPDRAADPAVARWRAVRSDIHHQVCALGFDQQPNSFVQSYGSKQSDASLLLLMHVGFLPASDPRITATVARIGQCLMRGGLILRYDTEDSNIDGLSGSEGAFLPCSFWYADNLIAQERLAEAKAILDRLILISNDVGLLAEEYCPAAKTMLGNFPQAFSHVALVNSVLRFARSSDLQQRPLPSFGNL